MKKLLTLLLALTLVLSLAACTAGERTPEASTTAAPTTTVPEEDAAPEETTAAPEEADETEATTAAPEEEEEPSDAGPAVNVVYDDARTLIEDFLDKLMAGEVDATSAMFAPDAFENFELSDLADAAPTVHEILWENGFLELRLKDETYVTLAISKDDAGHWLFNDIVTTSEFFKRDGDVQLKSEGDKKWHFENLSGLPATQLNNAGEVILIPAQQKRILNLERWDDTKNVRAVVKLLEMNGTSLPAEIFYKQGDKVINIKNIDASFGIFFYPGEDSVWIDRIVELLGIE